MENSLVVRVAEIQVETPEIRALRLERLDGAPFGEWQSGAHIDVTGPTGVLRQYSLAGSPRDDSSIWIAVRKTQGPGGGSTAIHELQVGDHLKISKPRNLFGIAPDADKHVLIAGGIGVTPLMSMAFEFYSWGVDFELHYFAHSREQMAFADFLTERVEYRDFVTLHVGVPREQRPAVLETDCVDGRRRHPRLHLRAQRLYGPGGRGLLTRRGRGPRAPRDIHTEGGRHQWRHGVHCRTRHR